LGLVAGSLDQAMPWYFEVIDYSRVDKSNDSHVAGTPVA
jgi:hypothetical protein